jgi:hypothetical protein
MQRFKPNDAIFILPRFADLYPANSGTVVSFQADPFRPMFNEYTIEFADRSIASVLEFQIIEDLPNYNTLIAHLAFDSRHEPAIGIRGDVPGWQIVLQTAEFDLHMKINTTKSRASIMGQVLERSTDRLLNNLTVQVMKEGMPVCTARSDDFGMFKCSDISRGSLNILITLPQYLKRIFGAFQT